MDRKNKNFEGVDKNLQGYHSSQGISFQQSSVMPSVIDSKVKLGNVSLPEGMEAYRRQSEIIFYLRIDVDGVKLRKDKSEYFKI